MKYLTAEQIRTLAPTSKEWIVNGIVEAQEAAYIEAGANTALKYVVSMSQFAHEAAHFRTLLEYADGSAYEGRRDLGNVNPGDGRRFRGRGVIQRTGRFNAKRGFLYWKELSEVGDLQEYLDRLENDSRFALRDALLWLNQNNAWRTFDAHRNQGFRSAYRAITKRINGGYNGYANRVEYFEGFALLYLDYGQDVRGFQMENGCQVDGVCGPETRQKLFEVLRDGDFDYSIQDELDQEEEQPELPLGPVVVSSPKKKPSSTGWVEVIVNFIRRIFGV